MERIRNLNRYQKGILIILIAMVLVFTVIYAITTSREGYLYENAILRPSEENGNTVYSGRIYATRVSFTVTPDKTVTYRYGDEVYGPYTAKLDPTAVPDGYEHMTGVEVRMGDKVIFRGGADQTAAGLWLQEENPYLQHSITNGSVTPSPEPSIYDILKLMDDPELTRKGIWLAWVLGTFMCLITVPTILFADEIFQFVMSFRVYSVDGIEPSEWEMISRYIAWTAAPIAALVLFIMGLQ